MEYPVFKYAGNQWHFAMHKDDSGFFGGIYQNRPTPSECDRWMIQYSDNRRFETPEEADRMFKVSFHEDLLGAEQTAHEPA